MIREWLESRHSLAGARAAQCRGWGGALSRHLPRIDPGLLALVAGGFAWETVGQWARLSFLPPLSSVLLAAKDLIVSGQILEYLAASLFSLTLGYVLAVAAGVALGLLMGRYRQVEYLLDIYVNGFLAAPKIVFVPLLYALFGIGRGTQVAIVFMSAVFIIIINTMSAVRAVDADYLEMARAFGASERQLVLRVLLPGALPVTMAGLRLGIGRAVKGMINGEMFIAVFGLGGLLRLYGGRFDAEKVFAILLIVVLVALLFTAVVRGVERRLTAWTEASA